MNSKKQLHTAVLVFANSSAEELKHKPMTKGGLLFDSLTQQAIKTVEKSGLPYFHYTEKQQIGDTFGTRFTNAIQEIFNKGYERIITIGNDTPQLKVSHILEAAQAIQPKNFVLGQSKDGGFYLMGIHKSQFKAPSFEKLAWQTAKLSSQLLQLIAGKNIKVKQLEKFNDIDYLEDIRSIINFSFKLPNQLRLLLLKVLELQQEKYHHISSQYRYTTNRIFRNKGSPTALQF